MSLSTQSAGIVRGKAFNAVANGRTSNPTSPVIFHALKALFLHLSMNKGNPDLAWAPFVSTTVDDAGGQVLIDAACTLYAVYGKKANTATDVYLVIFDDATDDAGAGTDGRVVLPFLTASGEGFYINPDGISMPSGVVAKAYTDFDGTTDSTASDCPDGFVIVGA